jgi:N-acetylmuramoyl-L-alanine amidase
MNWKHCLKWICYTLLCCFASSALCAEKTVSLLDYKVQAKADEVTITLSFDRSVHYHCLLLPEPDRFVVDFEQTQFQNKLPKPIAENFLLKGFRSSNHDDKFLRIVFDLKDKITYTTKFSQSKNNSYQLVIELLTTDLQSKSKKTWIASSPSLRSGSSQRRSSETSDGSLLRQSGETSEKKDQDKVVIRPTSLRSESLQQQGGETSEKKHKGVTGSEKTTQKKSIVKNEDSNTTESEIDKENKIELEPTKLSILPLKPVAKLALAKDLKTRRIVIVIDPGHGGKDPGAAGPHGTVEKNVVLQIAKELQRLLNEQSGFSAVLTRNTDHYISLRKRLAIARKNHADMFIAIHADAYHHEHATGASIYALSQRGATSEAARWLAEKENESELGGLGSELADKDAILRSVLIDLSQTHTIESSLQIGDTVLQELGKFARLHHPKVEQAAFVVLKSPDIPSILVETGFLSNPSEENKLVKVAYQHQTAYAIKEGIRRYFELNPPGGT